jgi:hypothetical protein
MGTPERELANIRRDFELIRHNLAGRGPIDLPQVDITEFALSDRFLNLERLHPRQSTLLKTTFLEDELFTQFDEDTLGGWIDSYLATADETGEGNNGIVPDVRERIAILKAAGRRYFREVIAVVGRRGGKNHLGAIELLYILYELMRLDNPQAKLGIDQNKTLTMLIFAANFDQARFNQFRDIGNMVSAAPIFKPFLLPRRGSRLRLLSPHDLRRADEGDRFEVFASFEIVAKESTSAGARGVASVAQVYDEAAHTVPTGTHRSLDELYSAATPALDEFKNWAFILMPSSPRHRKGKLYERYTAARERDGDGPAYPELLMYQLTSWDPYEDHLRAHTIPMKPGGEMFPKIDSAPQEFDLQMRRLQRANREEFEVERLSHFANSQSAFLNVDDIKKIWLPWPGPDDPLTTVKLGSLGIDYYAHGDPARGATAPFGFSIAHVTEPDHRGLPHIIFDQLRSWRAEDFDEGRIDLEVVEADIERIIDDFEPRRLSFDQYDSGLLIQRLETYSGSKKRPKRVEVVERTATAAVNRKTYGTLKEALGLGLVHAPYHLQADLELQMLEERNGKVQAPSVGPCKTKDIADAMAVLTEDLLGDSVSVYLGRALGELQLRASQQGGFPRLGEEDPIVQSFKRFSRGLRRNWHGEQRMRRRDKGR